MISNDLVSLYFFNDTVTDSLYKEMGVEYVRSKLKRQRYYLQHGEVRAPHSIPVREWLFLIIGLANVVHSTGPRVSQI